MAPSHARVAREAAREALTGESVGQLLSSEIITFACRSRPDREKATPSPPQEARWATDAAESSEPVHAWTFQAREPGDPVSFLTASWRITVVGNGQSTSQTALLA